RCEIHSKRGALVQVGFEKTPAIADVLRGLSRINLGDAIIQEFGTSREYIIRASLGGAGAAEELGLERGRGAARREKRGAPKAGEGLEGRAGPGQTGDPTGGVRGAAGRARPPVA